MKRLLKTLTIIAITTLYLMATTGFGVHHCEVCQSSDIVLVGSISDSKNCCSSGKEKASCHTAKSSHCCKSEQSEDSHHNTFDYTLSENCCSLTYEFLEADYTNNEKLSFNVVYNPPVFVANLTAAENIADACIRSAKAYFSPPNPLEGTLPIYLFCQLRL